MPVTGCQIPGIRAAVWQWRWPDFFLGAIGSLAASLPRPAKLAPSFGRADKRPAGKGRRLAAVRAEMDFDLLGEGLAAE
jgi:hypothetical protein